LRNSKVLGKLARRTEEERNIFRVKFEL